MKIYVTEWMSILDSLDVSGTCMSPVILLCKVSESLQLAACEPEQYHIPFLKASDWDSRTQKGVTEGKEAELRCCCLSCCPHAFHPFILPCCTSCLFINPLSPSVQGKLLISIFLSKSFILVSWHTWHNIYQLKYVGRSNKWVEAAGPGFALAPTSLWSSLKCLFFYRSGRRRICGW